jgi:hypothetical protein
MAGTDWLEEPPIPPGACDGIPALYLGIDDIPLRPGACPLDSTRPYLLCITGSL